MCIRVADESAPTTLAPAGAAGLKPTRISVGADAAASDAAIVAPASARAHSDASSSDLLDIGTSNSVAAILSRPRHQPGSCARLGLRSDRGSDETDDT